MPTVHPILRLHISPVVRWRPPGSMLNCTRWFVDRVSRCMAYNTSPVLRMSQHRMLPSCRAPVYRKLPSCENCTCGTQRAASA
jgi:hypothetical protein